MELLCRLSQGLEVVRDETEVSGAGRGQGRQPQGCKDSALAQQWRQRDTGLPRGKRRTALPPPPPGRTPGRAQALLTTHTPTYSGPGRELSVQNVEGS